jgi:hypothetical protein
MTISMGWSPIHPIEASSLPVENDDRTVRRVAMAWGLEVKEFSDSNFESHVEDLDEGWG